MKLITIILITLTLVSCEGGGSGSSSSSSSSSSEEKVTESLNIDRFYGEYEECRAAYFLGSGIIESRLTILSISPTEQKLVTKYYADNECGATHGESQRLITITNNLDIKYTSRRLESDDDGKEANYYLTVEYLDTVVQINNATFSGYDECETTLNTLDIDYTLYQSCPLTRHGKFTKAKIDTFYDNGDFSVKSARDPIDGQSDQFLFRNFIKQ